jgi:hypothetical protein
MSGKRVTDRQVRRYMAQPGGRSRPRRFRRAHRAPDRRRSGVAQSAGPDAALPHAPGSLRRGLARGAGADARRHAEPAGDDTARRTSASPSRTLSRPHTALAAAPGGALAGDRGAGTGADLSPGTSARPASTFRFHRQLQARGHPRRRAVPPSPLPFLACLQRLAVRQGDLRRRELHRTNRRRAGSAMAARRGASDRIAPTGFRRRTATARFPLYGCGPHGAAWSSFTSCVISSGRNFEGKALDEILVREH